MVWLVELKAETEATNRYKDTRLKILRKLKSHNAFQMQKIQLTPIPRLNQQQKKKKKPAVQEEEIQDMDSEQMSTAAN